MKPFSSCPSASKSRRGRPLNGKLLADGFHRVAAAKNLGRETIKARVHTGDRDEAMVFAATANVRHGLPLTQKQRRAAIERLLDAEKGWSDRDIAKKMGVSPDTVGNVVMCRKVGVEISTPETLMVSHLVEIGWAPREYWQALADRAAEDGWSARETRAAVNMLKADDVSQEQKEAILDGGIPPFDARPDDDGDPVVFVETLRRLVALVENAIVGSSFAAVQACTAGLLRLAGGRV